MRNEQAIRLAWSIGRLDYMKLPLQKKFDADYERAKLVNNEFYLEASRRASKSSWLFIKFNELCRRHAGTHYAFVAPVAKGLDQYVEKIMSEVLTDCPPDLRPKLDVAKHILRFRNGSTITFAGSDNKTYNHLRGNKFAGAGVDEAGFIDSLRELIEDILRPALFDSHGSLIACTTPPDLPDHPWFEFYGAALLKGYGAHYTIYDTHYTEAEINSFAAKFSRALDPEDGKKSIAFRREMLCEHVVDREKLIIPEWKPEFEMDWRDKQFFSFYHKYEGMDNGAGVMDFTITLLGHYDFRKAWLVIDAEVGPMKEEGVRTDFLAAGIRQAEVEAGYDKIYRRVGDNNNKILLQDLAGIHKLPFTPARKDDLQAMVNQARLWVSAGRVRVNPRCKYTIGCLKNGVWNRNRDDWAHTMTWGHFDALAALIYMIRVIDVATNPIPANFGMDIQTHNLNPAAKNASPNYEAIRQAFRMKPIKGNTEDWRDSNRGTPEWLSKLIKRPTQ